MRGARWLDPAREYASLERESAHTALVDERIIVVRHADLGAVHCVEEACRVRAVPPQQRYAAMEAARWLTARRANPLLPVNRELMVVPTDAGAEQERETLEDIVYTDAWMIYTLVCRAGRPWYAWYRRLWRRGHMGWHDEMAALIIEVLAQRQGAQGEEYDGTRIQREESAGRQAGGPHR